MYEAVYPYPDGDSTAARHARVAARHGYEGLVVRTEIETPVATLREQSDIDIVRGVEIEIDSPDTAGGIVASVRPEFEIVSVRGGDDGVNRFAVERDRVDVLARPMDGGEFNHVLAKAAKANQTRVEFDFGPALRAAGGPRVRALRGLRKLREIVDHYETPYVVTASPRSHLQMRAPRELVAVGRETGFEPEWLREGLAEWGVIAAQNRQRLSGEFIAPGVERGRYEEDA
ncbi:MAG: ribonuclease P protein subunit Rpp30 [uncultured archaeon A07HR60]|nr:MAG: ribonuclease P protein subunit Rpp30 [uncultured archaeon A07HR60]